MRGESATPTVNHLFDIAEYATKISRTDADLFHNFVAQLLYLSKQTHPYIRLEVSLLCTMVEISWHKLLQEYGKGDEVHTRHHWNKFGNINWYVDAEFAVHKDTSIHTDGFMTMVTVGDYFQSRKKLSTKSSTEANLFRVENIPTQVILTRYFLKEQGYEIHDNVIYKDNHSAIKL